MSGDELNNSPSPDVSRVAEDPVEERAGTKRRCRLIQGACQNVERAVLPCRTRHRSVWLCECEFESEPHIVLEPHHEIGSPDIVAQAEMQTVLHDRLSVVEIEKRFLPRRHKKGIQ